MAIREEFFLNRGGIKMVLYAGLLEEAHQQGLRSIHTDLIQCPTSENGDTAIIKAEITLEPEPNKIVRYEGYGDASPQNVSRNIVPHIIRMAETRAKARALRDAVNVGAVSLEEMGDEGDTPSQQRPSPQAASRPAQNNGQNNGQNVASDASVRYLIKLLADAGLDTEDLSQWSQKAVSDRIKELKPDSGSKA